MARTGELIDRITIRRRTETKNAKGGLDISWTTIATVWANVRSINGREAVIGNVLQGTSVFQATIRYRDDIRQADQLLWKGRELNVLNAEDLEGKRRWTVIQATTATPQGA